MQLVGIHGLLFPNVLMKQHQEELHQQNHLRLCRSLNNLLVRLQLQQELQ
jgi:hypothetical protein